jgi:hypothetical protein
VRSFDSTFYHWLSDDKMVHVLRNAAKFDEPGLRSKKRDGADRSARDFKPSNSTWASKMPIGQTQDIQPADSFVGLVMEQTGVFHAKKQVEEKDEVQVYRGIVVESLAILVHAAVRRMGFAVRGRIHEAGKFHQPHS